MSCSTWSPPPASCLPTSWCSACWTSTLCAPSCLAPPPGTRVHTRMREAALACTLQRYAGPATTCMPLGAQVYALTFVHSAFTMVGMWLFAAFGMFEVKRLAARQARTRPCQRAGPAFVQRFAAYEQGGACEPVVLPLLPPPRHSLCGQPHGCTLGGRHSPVLLGAAQAELHIRASSVGLRGRAPAGLPAGGGLCGLRGPLEPEPAAQPGGLLPAGEDPDRAGGDSDRGVLLRQAAHPQRDAGGVRALRRRDHGNCHRRPGALAAPAAGAAARQTPAAAGRGARMRAAGADCRALHRRKNGHHHQATTAAPAAQDAVRASRITSIISRHPVW